MLGYEIYYDFYKWFYLLYVSILSYEKETLSKFRVFHNK